MAGLGRVQQRFNAAVVGVLAALVSFARGGEKDAKGQASVGIGHPIHAKYLRTQNYGRATGRDLQLYPGYCSGAQETARRSRAINRSLTSALQHATGDIV